MDRICQQIRLFLAAALLFGSVITHADSVVHADSNGLGVTHGVSYAEATSGSVNLSEDDHDNSRHKLRLCLDAHCCSPALHITAQDSLRHTLENGRLRAAATSDYAFSVTYSLLRPPRAIA